MHPANYNDKELVAKLTAGDDAAWTYILVEVIAPLTRMRKYTETFFRYSLSTDAIITRCWMILQHNDYARLRKFRFESSLKTWLYLIVWEASACEIREKTGKIPFELSETDNFDALIATASSKDLELKDEMRLANQMLSKLWAESPRQVLVLLSRNCLNLASREVGAFLNESVSNVDQLNKRAKEKMKTFRKENCNE